MIPDYTIKWFQDRFKIYPSVTRLDYKPKEYIEELIIKSHLLQYEKLVYNHSFFYSKRLFEYDPSGILLFVNATDDTNFYDIFVLSLVEKQQIIDYVLNNLNKKYKNYGNNK